MGLKAVANVGGGGGGGTVTGTGTPGKLAKFATASSIGDSLLSESGTTITSAATAETFGSAQTWTVGAPNSQALVVLSNAGLERTLVLDTISRAVGVGVPTTPSTLLHVSDGVTTFAGTTGAGVRLDRATEALFSSSDGTRSLRAGLTGGTAVVGTSTATDMLLQRGNVTAATLTSGAIATLTFTSPGAGYTNGTYSQQALTGGTGSGATADFVVAGGTVTIMTLRSPGTGYAAGNALSCATLGAGAGLVVTVATISQVVGGSGNLTALGRIGAGTATPLVTGEFVGSVWSRKSESILSVNSSGTYTQFRAGILVNPDAEPTKQTVVTATENPILCGIGALSRYDLSARTTNTSVYGVYANTSITTQNASASGFAYGGLFISTSVSPTLSGASLNNIGVWAQATVTSTVTSANTITTLYAYDASVSCSATTAQSIQNAGYLVFRGANFSGAAHVVNDFYGLYLPTTTLLNSATITNRWGISQQDTLAKNYFAGNVGVTNTSPSYPLHVGAGNAAGIVTTGPTAYVATNGATSLVVRDATNGIESFIYAGSGVVLAGAASIHAYEIRTANTTRITVSAAGNTSIANTLSFNSGFGSASTAYGCRVWINFIGATAVIRGSGGVSSLVRTLAGTYTINYTTAMPDINYSAVATKQSNTVNTDCQLYDLFASRTTTSSVWVNVEATAVVDSANINIAFFR